MEGRKTDRGWEQGGGERKAEKRKRQGGKRERDEKEGEGEGDGRRMIKG